MTVMPLQTVELQGPFPCQGGILCLQGIHKQSYPVLLVFHRVCSGSIPGGCDSQSGLLQKIVVTTRVNRGQFNDVLLNQQGVLTAQAVTSVQAEGPGEKAGMEMRWSCRRITATRRAEAAEKRARPLPSPQPRGGGGQGAGEERSILTSASLLQLTVCASGLIQWGTEGRSPSIDFSLGRHRAEQKGGRGK